MALVTKSTPGRRKSLLALAAARRRNRRRIAEGLMPIVQGKKVPASSLKKHGGPGDHKNGSPQTVHGGGRGQDTSPQNGQRQQALADWQAMNEQVYQRQKQMEADPYVAPLDMPSGGGIGFDPYVTDDLFPPLPDFLDPLTDQPYLDPSYFQDSTGQITYYADEIQPDDLVYGPTGPFRVTDIDRHMPGTEGGPGYTPPPDLPADMLRLHGFDSSGAPIQIDLYRDQVAPPRITSDVALQISQLFKIFFKHYGPGKHKNGSPQSIHGNWSRGASSRQLMSLTQQNEGSTTELQSGVHPTEGWAVALHRYGQEIPEGRNPSADDIKRFVTSRYSALTEPDRFLGTWLDPETGSMWLDVVEVHDDFSVAEEIARAGNEIAIFNLATFETFNIEYDEVAQ